MSTWLVTGATGFVGRHVLQALVSERTCEGRPEDRVIVMGRRCPPGWPESAFVAVDLNDPENLRRAVLDIAPDRVIHTAGRTPPASDEELYRANYWATIRLLNTLRATNRPVRTVLLGSAAELGPVAAADLPVDETYSCRPADAYGRSKWMATIAGQTERSPLEVVVARVFNPIGPGLPPTQAFGQFAAQLTTRTADPVPMVVGDLAAKRDFVDVRDVAWATIALAQRGHAGLVYHVGTGESRQVGEGLDLLIRLSGRSVRVCADAQRPGRRGPQDSRADNRRIALHTGWRPTISFEKSLTDLWDEVKRQPHEAAGLPLTA